MSERITQPFVVINESQSRHIERKCVPLLTQWAKTWLGKNTMTGCPVPTDPSLFHNNRFALAWEDGVVLFPSADVSDLCRSLWSLHSGDFDHPHPITRQLFFRVMGDAVSRWMNASITLEECHLHEYESWGKFGSGAFALFCESEEFQCTFVFSPERTKQLLADFMIPPSTVPKLQPISTAILGQVVTVAAHLKDISLTLSVLKELESGDVIQLQHSATEPLTLRIHREKPLYEGILHQQEQHKALKINKSTSEVH